MGNEMQATPAAEDLARLKEVTGAPLFLSAEEVKTYDEMLVELLRCYKPRDFVEKLFIAEVVLETWEMRGHRRHADLTIKRQLRRQREFDVQRKKLAAQRKEARERAAVEKTAKPETELERVCELEEVCDRALDDARMLDNPPVELEYAEALEKTIVQREHFDTMLNSAVSRRNNDLRLIELYREGQRRHQAADEIVDAEFKQVTPQISQVEAPLVPRAEETQ
jgi:hypothetical protein